MSTSQATEPSSTASTHGRTDWYPDYDESE
jgi:hypothetical protein